MIGSVATRENEGLRRGNFRSARRKIAVALLVLILLIQVLAGSVGNWLGPWALHPPRRQLDPSMTLRAEQVFARAEAVREDLDVRAPDGVLLKGWKVRPRTPNGDWVLLYHGQSDNRMGMIGYAELLLRLGYSVTLMDARAHGASGGDMATYGWLERTDTRSVAGALYAGESVHCLFALGESMGAAIALQSAAVEPHIAGVVAESAFSSLREVSYDYAGFQMSPWLGRILFRPASIYALREIEREGNLPVDDVSPEAAVGARKFSVLLICDGKDRQIPCAHSRRIYSAAGGTKALWVVENAQHASALGTEPVAFKHRVGDFYAALHEHASPHGRMN